METALEPDPRKRGAEVLTETSPLKKTAQYKQTRTGCLEWFALCASRSYASSASNNHSTELSLPASARDAHFVPGHCLAVAAFDDDAPLSEARVKGWGNSPWAVGPYVYHIREVHPLPNHVSIKGSLGAYTLSAEQRRAILEQLPDGLVPPEAELRGISIKQPWLKRIMFEGKDVENRSSRIFTTIRAAVESKQHKPVESFMVPR